MEASDDNGSEASDVEKQIDKYKRLLQSLDDSRQASKDKDMDMEITWEPGKYLLRLCLLYYMMFS